MAVEKHKLIRTLFALAGVISLIAAVLPAIKGQPLNITFLGAGIFWLVLSVAVGRRSGSGAGPPSA